MTIRIKRRACCRADGRLYCIVELSNLPHESVGEICASACRGNAEVPVEAYPLDWPTHAPCYVLVVPFVDKAIYEVVLACGNEAARFALNCGLARWESSVIYRMRHDVVDRVRGIQDTWLTGRLRPSLDRLLHGDGYDVWRLSVRWQGSPGVVPAIVVTDGHGEKVDFDLVRLETQVNVPGRSGISECRVFYSIKVPEELRSLVVVVSDSEGRLASGFCSVDERFWQDKDRESWLHMRDASCDDERYASWFSRNRATRGDLASQAATSLAYEPLFSVVVPCYRSDSRFLAELVDSVISQSYSCWELLLLDSTPEDGVVATVAAKAADGRVRVIDTRGRKGIVQNTNAGIAKAKGDYIAFADHDDLLEPDALFRYVSALNVKDRPDVLFCDEDCFEAKGTYYRPSFKTELNVDLLYSHNCVTHFLCLSSALIKRIGPSPEDVAGAQDYDLTLRSLAANARFEHVPRVLYHWREHADSTSGDNVGAKPYADEAGRLALERHMAQRGIGVAVELTRNPFVYRVRYALPARHPLVSVVIPSRDHADALCACVTSVLEKSSYDALEVVVVENNSVEEATRTLYDRLSITYGERVRVVDASAPDAAFNYSRLINVGAAAARGEYLLLLNNDTEVITPDFVEEMLGYLQRPEVGVVGAKLYFRDGLTQHAGIVVGPYGSASHPNQDFPPSRLGYLGRAVRPGNFSAVTGACQMVSHAVFDEVGGYDEEFAVGFNDVDFCFRVRATGRLVTFTPYAELFHYEFTSRGREVVDRDKLRRWKREQALFTERWPEVFLEGDTYTSPNLDVNSHYFSL